MSQILRTRLEWMVKIEESDSSNTCLNTGELAGESGRSGKQAIDLQSKHVVFQLQICRLCCSIGHYSNGRAPFEINSITKIYLPSLLTEFYLLPALKNRWFPALLKHWCCSTTWIQNWDILNLYQYFSNFKNKWFLVLDRFLPLRIKISLVTL